LSATGSSRHTCTTVNAAFTRLPRTPATTSDPIGGNPMPGHFRFTRQAASGTAGLRNPRTVP
jgi:hypothetical protein